MANLQEISRVVYRHDWAGIDDWVQALDDLAELSDDDIDEIERLGRDPDDKYFE